MKNTFAALASIALFSTLSEPPQPKAKKQKSVSDFLAEEMNKPKEPQPKPGQKEYFFNSKGLFDNNKMLRTECVFKCFAINDKNAIKKFNKFKQHV